MNRKTLTFNYDTGLSKEVTPTHTIYYEHNSNGELISLTINNQTYFYHFNSHGDTIALSDTNQNIIATYQYDPYGNIISEYNPQQIPNPYLYVGAYSVRYDKDIDLYLMTTRYFSPKTGRFITKDKYPGKKAIPITLNPYQYCENNPVNNIDPLGMETWRKKVIRLPRSWKITVYWSVNPENGEVYFYFEISNGSGPDISIKVGSEDNPFHGYVLVYGDENGDFTHFEFDYMEAERFTNALNEAISKLSESKLLDFLNAIDEFIGVGSFFGILKGLPGAILGGCLYLLIKAVEWGYSINNTQLFTRIYMALSKYMGSLSVSFINTGTYVFFGGNLVYTVPQ